MNQSKTRPDQPLRTLIVKSLIWQSTGQMSERVVRFAVHIILARWLMPEHFGLAGAVAMVLAMVDSALFIGSTQAILQSERGRNREFLDTAFWVGIVRGVVIGAVVLVLSPWLANLIGQRRVEPMFAVLALQPVVSALASPKAPVILKDLRFGVWSLYQVGGNTLGLAATVFLAIRLQNAWALVLGQVLTQLVMSAGSYLVAPYRPRWRIDRDSWRELWRFGLGISGVPLLMILILQAPALLLGRWEGMVVLGMFLLNQRLAQVPQNLLTRIVGAVAFPAFSSIKKDSARLADSWVRGLRTLSLLILPWASAMIAVDRALPTVVYGAQFSLRPGLFALLAVDGALVSISVMTEPLLWALGLPAYDRAAQLVRLGVLYLTIVAFFSTDMLMGLAVGYAVSAFVGQVLLLFFARKAVGVDWYRVIGALAPGLAIGLLIMVILTVINRLAGLTPLTFVAAGGMAVLPVMIFTAGWVKRSLRAGRQEVTMLPASVARENPVYTGGG